MALLLDLVRPAIRERKAKTEAVTKAIEGATITWENGLSEKEKDKISLLMFGKDGPGKSEKTSRLLKSTIELGFPQAGT